jgi:TolA-binding protein
MRRFAILLATLMLFFASSIWTQEEPLEYLRGMNLYKEGKYKEAREEFKKFLTRYPNSPLAPEAHFRLAEATEDFWKATREYRNLTLRYSDNAFAPKAQFRIGQYYYLKGDYEQSLKDYRKLLEVYPQSPYAPASQYWIGSILLAQKKYGEARREFEGVLKNYPQSNYLDWAQVGIGNSYFKKGNYSLAWTEYQKALENYPKSNILNLIYFNLGECYEKKGKEKEALEIYQKLISQCPDSLEAIDVQKKISALQKKFLPVEGKYSVQVGAFSERARADRLVKRLKGKGYNSYIMIITIEGRRFHRVRVGRLATEAEAQELARKLKKEENLPTRIFSD